MTNARGHVMNIERSSASSGMLPQSTYWSGPGGAALDSYTDPGPLFMDWEDGEVRAIEDSMGRRTITTNSSKGDLSYQSFTDGPLAGATIISEFGGFGQTGIDLIWPIPATGQGSGLPEHVIMQPIGESGLLLSKGTGVGDTDYLDGAQPVLEWSAPNARWELRLNGPNNQPIYAYRSAAAATYPIGTYYSLTNGTGEPLARVRGRPVLPVNVVVNELLIPSSTSLTLDTVPAVDPEYDDSQTTRLVWASANARWELQVDGVDSTTVTAYRLGGVGIETDPAGGYFTAVDGSGALLAMVSAGAAPTFMQKNNPEMRSLSNNLSATIAVEGSRSGGATTGDGGPSWSYEYSTDQLDRLGESSTKTATLK